MTGANTMLKTLVFGLAGIYVIKVVADTEAPKPIVVREKIDAASGGTYDNHDKAFQDLRKSIYNSGSDASQKAMSMYEEAYQKAVDAKKKLESGSNNDGLKFWADSDDALRQKYQEAQKNLEDAKNSLGKYSQDYNSILQDDLNRASDYASKKVQNAVDSVSNYKVTAEDKLQANLDYYHKQAEQAKADWDSTKASWWRWRKAQTKEVQDRAQEKYNYFKQQNDKAVDSLVDYLQEQGRSVKEVFDKYVNKQKDNLDYAGKYAADLKDRAVAAGYDAKDSVKDNAEYAKNYAAGAKDSVVQAGYDAKDKVQDRAEVAKHYAAGGKDRVVQAGYDGKEKVEENADYAKHYVAGKKDRLAQAGYNAKDRVEDDAEYAKHYAGGAKDSVVQAGYNAKDRIQDDAEYVKNYAGGTKDSVLQAGYNAKDRIQDNAEYAKNYAAGTKDSIVQAGYDAKDQIQDDAEYAKHYAAGTKDRVAQAGYDTKNEAEGYVSGAKDWIEKAGSATKNYLKDKYQTLWNSVGVFKTNSRELAEEAVAYYDAEANKARREYYDTQASWFRWRAAQSQEVQDEAKARWEVLKAKDEAARSELQRWKNEVVDK